ncbi:23S rRNA (guanosine(2251)-2'-O)-methyltransferase RlmB [Sandaracinus amylolyticus]|uniref:23S rRNA (Guanosine-2'-O-)-methyltransferase rlmB n=1 Tax=Sandaracinus amylolyticus TaxID=927083 RepID=A0A0F6YJJ4_9BACT|nr:23S rRNA (guanosine(2251)-2'-O)-methyltransferase RlmB [Sandaracinus amylolyticus]AKF07088.1 23S rRNA (guanosine-2'-O-) -methyltransferase rlmB [Sandaracinus amylolyticus]
MKRVVAGPRAVIEALRARAGAIHVIYVEEGAKPSRELETELRAKNVKVEPRPRAELEALAPDGRHQGIVAITGEYPYASLEEALVAARERPLFVALDEITDPHNFGAIVRSAVAFGADGVLTLKDRAAPVTPVVVRASAGATEHARIARVTNLARTLASLAEDHEMQIVGLAMDGDVAIDELPAAERGRVLVIGSEGKGMRPLVRKQCTVVARIDMEGPVASLNASVAAGIALHAASRARARELSE